jgi:kinesin family protein C1
MIPRAVEQLFMACEKYKEKFWQYEFEVNFLEIYNEQLRDLLTKKQAEAYEIKHDAKGHTSVTNLTTCKVKNPNQVFELLVRASAARATAATKMNERSSRSHSVFQIKVNGANTVTNETVKATLSLVDLAGSERADKSGASGDAFKEMVNINKSLSSLGDVIASLGKERKRKKARESF